MKATFHFSLLHYVYDPLTQEFVNIGVVVYSPEHRFLRASFTMRYSRITKMFGRIEGNTFRVFTRYIENQIAILNDKIERGLLFLNPNKDLQTMLAEILPKDDTSIRFAPGGIGITEDPAQSLEILFKRYVTRYETPGDSIRRDEDDVWKSFQESFRTKRVFSHLVTKKITAPDYEYEFKRSWKNGKWHLFEPVSFDLADESSLLEKAARWVGRTTVLSSSSEQFKLFLLLGEPSDHSLDRAFRKAQNLLRQIPIEWESVREQDAEQFAEQIDVEFRQHELESQR